MKARNILIATVVALGGLGSLAMAATQIGAGTFDGPAWRELLGTRDLEAREREYGRLVEEARENAGARARLREWAEGEGDLAWTSRLALRELELREQLDAMGRGLRGQRGLGRSRFGADPFADFRRGMFDHPFFNGAFNGAFGEDPFSGLDLSLQGGSQSSSELQMETTPDGVKIEVRENVDGKEKVTTYEGKSLEELLQAHPELRDRIDVAPRLGPHGLGGLFGQAQPFGNLPPDAFGGASFGGVPTDKLGILMREPGSFEAPAGVEAGTGLLVERVLPGTLADALGIRSGDVVVRLNGEPIGSAEDVRAVLSKLEPGTELTADVVEQDGSEQTLRYQLERTRHAKEQV
jgi:hypothetical protein